MRCTVSTKVGMVVQVRDMRDQALASNSPQIYKQQKLEDTVNRGLQDMARGVITLKTIHQAQRRTCLNTRWILEAALPHPTQIAEWPTPKITHTIKNKSISKKCQTWWKSTQVTTRLLQIWWILREIVPRWALLNSLGALQPRKLDPNPVSQCPARWNRWELVLSRETCILIRATLALRVAQRRELRHRSRWNLLVVSRTESGPERPSRKIQEIKSISR